MSAPHQKLPASNITCRYWATSGTCFFGDQCNFAHNIADRATSGRPVPRREKACKELLLTGYCKNETNGCEYNHSIPGVTYSGPPTPPPTTTTGGPQGSALSPIWSVISSRASTAAAAAGISASPGTAAATAIRNKGLPVTAPAFVPAAVAAAQRASLTAWGGLSPGGGGSGGGRGLSSVNSNADYVSSTTCLDVTSSPLQQNGILESTEALAGSILSISGSLGEVGRPLESDSSSTITPEGLSGPAFVTSTLPTSLNAQQFVPSNHVSSDSVNGNTLLLPIQQPSSATSTVGSASAPQYVPSAVAFALGAAPFVPKAKQQPQQQQHLHSGGTMGSGRSLSDQQQSPVGMGVPPQQLQFRQHMSQLHHLHQQHHQAAHVLAVAARGVGGNAMSSPYMTMDVPMVMQPLQPFRLPDGDDPALGMTAMSPPTPAFAIPIARASNRSLPPPALPAPEALASVGIVSDGSGGLTLGGGGFPSHKTNYGSRMQSPSTARSQHIHQDLQKLQMQQQHPPPPRQLSDHTHPFSLRQMQKSDSEQPIVTESSVTAAQQQKQQQMSQQQQQQSPSNQLQQQHLQALQQRQQQLEHQQVLHQHQLQLFQQRVQQHQHQQSSQIAITSPVQSQQRQQQRAPFHASPASQLSAASPTIHGGATYFLGPGQGISNLPPHVSQGPFSGSAGRVEGRIRGQGSSVGLVPVGPRFSSDQLREELRRRHALVHAQLDTEQNLVNLPEEVQRFHTLYPLEEVNQNEETLSTALGVHSMIFKGISLSDGIAYAIRRIDSRQVPPNRDLAASAAEVVEKWAPLSRHPHLVAIRESFVSREINDSPALFLVHDYFPGAVTLEAMHLHEEQAGGGGGASLMVSEDLLWSYIVQLAAVLRAVHSVGLFFRPGGLHPSKVILPTRGRLRVSSAGVLDVLNGDLSDDHRVFQREDLVGFGRLIMSLACSSVTNPSLDFMALHYSADLVEATQALLASSLDKPDGGGGGGGITSIRQLSHALTQRMFNEIEVLHLQNDELMTELSKETENGRLLRILVKLGMTNERPEDDVEPGWSDSGDRYLLKLFRDFVFHQTTEDGTPLIDWTHVMDSLNKLDAGVPEKMMLLSRDERSMLFASYGDLKRCLESAYQDLANRGLSSDTGRSNMAGAQASLALNSRLMQSQISLG